jgi:hypothetical protein
VHCAWAIEINLNHHMKTTPLHDFRERSSRGESRGLRAHGSFPLTDYQFRSTADARSVAAFAPGKTSHVSEVKNFRKLSSEFLGDETTRDYVKEAILFTIIVAISAWPIIQMVGALARLVR